MTGESPYILEPPVAFSLSTPESACRAHGKCPLHRHGLLARKALSSPYGPPQCASEKWQSGCDRRRKRKGGVEELQGSVEEQHSFVMGVPLLWSAGHWLGDQ